MNLYILCGLIMIIGFFTIDYIWKRTRIKKLPLKRNKEPALFCLLGMILGMMFLGVGIMECLNHYKY